MKMLSRDYSNKVRQPAIAGTFYPDDRSELESLVHNQLASSRRVSVAESRSLKARNLKARSLKALIVPHAGLVYSGEIAARGYALLEKIRSRIKRVVLLGPVHRVAVDGIVASSSTAFMTPLGEVSVDSDFSSACVEKFSFVSTSDVAHEPEHSLEVQLPFLQTVLADFSLVPLLVGNATPEQVRQCLEFCWGGDETIVLISSDLSHYHSYDRARTIDQETTEAILTLDQRLIGYDHACGQVGVNGLLGMACQYNMTVELLDLRNSGDTSGSRDRVVGYGCYAFFSSVAAWDERARDLLTGLVKKSIEHGLAHGECRRFSGSSGIPRIDSHGACFVTLKDAAGGLRGCIGSLEATMPLSVNVNQNAFAAAFRDPRFPPLSLAEWPATSISISVLGEPEQIYGFDLESIMAQVEPGKHGLILKHGGKRGTFLPAVWQHTTDPVEFFTQIQEKAGIDPKTPVSDIEMFRYTTESW